MPNNASVLDISAALQALRKRWKLVAAIFLVTFVATGLKTLTTTKTYRATAKVLVRREDRPGELNPTYSRLTQEEEIKSEVEIAGSRPVLARVLQALHPDLATMSTQVDDTDVTFATPAFAGSIENDTALAFETALAGLENRLTIEAVPGSNVIEIGFNDSDPQRAQWLANALANEYSAYNAQVFGGKQADQFLLERIQITRGRLDSLQNALAAARSANGLISLDRKEAMLLEKFRGFDTQLSQTHKQREVLTARIQHWEQTRSAGDTLTIPSVEMDAHPTVRQLYAKLVDLRLQRNDLLKKYRPEYRAVKDLSKQIEEIHWELALEITRLCNLQNEQLNTLHLEESSLAQIVSTLEAGLKELPDRERDLQDLELAVQSTRKIYSEMVSRQEELSIEKATDPRISRVAVISPAGLPLDPIKPQAPRDILLGALVGLLAGVVAALAQESWSRRTTAWLHRRMV